MPGLVLNCKKGESKFKPLYNPFLCTLSFGSECNCYDMTHLQITVCCFSHSFCSILLRFRPDLSCPFDQELYQNCDSKDGTLARESYLCNFYLSCHNMVYDKIVAQVLHTFWFCHLVYRKGDLHPASMRSESWLIVPICRVQFMLKDSLQAVVTNHLVVRGSYRSLSLMEHRERFGAVHFHSWRSFYNWFCEFHWR